MSLTYDQLVDRIIADGIAEVQVAYADPKDHYKRDGAIEGFEACRGKSPTELVKLWQQTEGHAENLVHAHDADPEGDDLNNYWRLRYKALQVEFVLNVISVGLNQPLLSHLPTYRGAVKYAQIVGVHGGEESTS